MLVIQSSRHYSEQILARQGEVKGKRAKLRKESEGVFFKMKSSDDGRGEFSGVSCQGFSIPDGGGKFIPPARNGQ